MSLINCKINLILVIVVIDAPVENQVPTFTITDTKLYVLVVTLSPQDDAKLL